MANFKKKQLLDIVETLKRANNSIENAQKDKEDEVIDALGQCQELAVNIGEDIETRGEAGEAIVAILEEYCEDLYQISISLQDENLRKKLAKKIRKQLVKVSNGIRFDLPEDKKEIVFLPYKAAMWDSLESIWMAARDDENCETHVIPIPYFDKNPDGSLGQMHYEGDDYPDYVPITSWEKYDIAGRRPDVIYIHNPYDDWNHVTTIHPIFYSSNLKNYTKKLIYVPYYATSGGMSEGQKLLSAYENADYIVIQTEKYSDYFDKSIPAEKLLPFGSPKFDRVIRKCQNPPEAPADWKEKMAGKKVYFYNTSINGMLSDTASFLKKMEYVFTCFEGREDACLLWRPHPLLESTFDSMRAQYKPIYDTLKRWFIEGNIGVYDTTPDVTDTIALCDAYIGDSATSITALFGIAGKPLFILDNRIHSEPSGEDWRGEVVTSFDALEEPRWMITQGNKLYYSKDNDYSYRYYCDLEEYSQGSYYGRILNVEEKFYICPISAQDILVIGEQGIEKKILLDRRIEKAGAFYISWKYEYYILLVPCNYPAVVRYDTRNGEIRYFTEYLDVFVKNDNGNIKIGGSCIHKGYLFIASPTDSHVYSLHIETGKAEVRSNGMNHNCGASVLTSYLDEIWFLPYDGKIITRWNPETGEKTEYSNMPQELVCIHPIYQYECEELPFSNMVFYGDDAYLAPQWANMYIKLNTETGEMTEWIPPFEVKPSDDGYYFAAAQSYLLNQQETGSVHNLYSIPDRKVYQIDFGNGSCEEISISFDIEELKMHESGFGKFNEWLQYGCMENAFNSLPDFLDGNITGGVFHKEEQIQAYEIIAANHDGSCGQKVHEFVMAKILER